MEYIKTFESWAKVHDFFKRQVQKRRDYIILRREKDYNTNNFKSPGEFKTDYFLQFLEVDRYDKYGFYGFILYMIGDPDNWDNDYRDDGYMGAWGSDGVPHYFSERVDKLEILFRTKKKKEAEKFLEELKKKPPYSEWISEWEFKDTANKYNL